MVIEEFRVRPPEEIIAEEDTTTTLQRAEKAGHVTRRTLGDGRHTIPQPPQTIPGMEFRYRLTVSDGGEKAVLHAEHLDPQGQGSVPDRVIDSKINPKEGIVISSVSPDNRRYLHSVVRYRA